MHMKRWLHDQKHHLAVLGSLAAQGDVPSLQNYLLEYAGDFHVDIEATATGNRVLDALLAAKSMQCREQHIDLRSTVRIDGPLPLSDTELASVVGNALDNAIEACHAVSADPFVELTIDTQNAMYKLSVANSSAGSYCWVGGQLASTKGDGRGFGLARIRRLVEKAGGFVQAKPGETMFRLNIWLPRRSA